MGFILSDAPTQTIRCTTCEFFTFSVNGETVVDSDPIAKNWIDESRGCCHTGQEVVATPNMQALAEAIDNEILRIVSKPDVLEAISTFTLRL